MNKIFMDILKNTLKDTDTTGYFPFSYNNTSYPSLDKKRDTNNGYSLMRDIMERFKLIKHDHTTEVTENEYIIKALVPNISDDDINVSYYDNTIEIKITVKDNDFIPDGTYAYSEKIKPNYIKTFRAEKREGVLYVIGELNKETTKKQIIKIN